MEYKGEILLERRIWSIRGKILLEGRGIWSRRGKYYLREEFGV